MSKVVARSQFSNNTYYLDVLDPFYADRYARDAIAALKALDFEAIAFSGMSGALIAPSVAIALNKPLLLVRKPTDDSHASGDAKHGCFKANKFGFVEGATDASKYIIIDDFMSSGNTLIRIKSAIDECSVVSRRPVPACIGVYLYRYNELFVRNPPTGPYNSYALRKVFEQNS